MKTNTIVFLQNAWSELYAGKKWPRKSWLSDPVFEVVESVEEICKAIEGSA